MRIPAGCIALLLAAALLHAGGLFAADADASKPAKPVPPLASIIHDLRDFLPSAESDKLKPDEPIPAFSVRDDGTWKAYRDYNANKSGYLSRSELKAAVADLVKELRERYPDAFAAIDTDGDETITWAKLQVYLKGGH